MLSRVSNFSGPISVAFKGPLITGSSSFIVDNLFMKLDASSYTTGTWLDETLNGNNATINGATWLSNDGGIFDFDGVNDTISIPHVANLSLNTTTQRSIQVWVKFDTIPALSTQVPVFGKLSSSFGFDGYWGGLYSNGGVIRTVTNGTSQQRVVDSVLTITTNTWYLITFISQITSTTNTTKLYINETEYISTSHGSDSYSESNPLYLGFIGAGVSSLYLNGKIGACYFYTKGLSTSEISTNYNLTKTRYINPTTSNLILHYDPINTLSYSGSGTTINNLVGGGLNGTMANITYTSPYFTYNGSTSQVSIADNASLEPGSGEFTMEVWFYRSNNTGSTVILGKFDNGGLASNVSYSIRTSNSTLTAQIGKGTGSVLNVDYINSTSYTYLVNTWYQVVYVWKPGISLETYINGASIGSVSNSLTSILNSTNPLYLGRYNGGEYSQNFAGRIGVVRLYNRALTSTEVSNNYNSTKGIYI
jgi:hypothetical protein